MNKKYSTFRLSAQAIADQGDVVRRISLATPTCRASLSPQRRMPWSAPLMIAGMLARGEAILTTSDEMASICGGVIRQALLNSERPLIQSIYEAAARGCRCWTTCKSSRDGEGRWISHGQERARPGQLGDIGEGDLKTLADAIPTNKAAMN